MRYSFITATLSITMSFLNYFNVLTSLMKSLKLLSLGKITSINHQFRWFILLDLVHKSNFGLKTPFYRIAIDILIFSLKIMYACLLRYKNLMGSLWQHLQINQTWVALWFVNVSCRFSHVSISKIFLQVSWILYSTATEING